VKILHTLKEFKPTQKPVFLAIGCFDGVHIGHQAVIQTAKHHALKTEGQIWVLTFSPHPAKLFDPSHAPPLISTQEQQLLLFQKIGVNGVIIQPFTTSFINLQPAQFFNQLLTTLSPLAGLFVGENWTFGKNRSGTTQILQQFCTEKKIIFSAHNAICWKNKRVSSTRIRKAFQLGQIEDLKKMLGREPSTIGTVIHGEQIGRTLGFPTANIQPQNELLPPHGIYAAHLRIGSKIYPAAAYLGRRSTFHTNAPAQLEVHLIDQTNINLYEKTVEVSYISYIRTDQHFNSPEALKKQIAKDLIIIRNLLKAKE